MPWVRRHSRSTQLNWIVGITGGLLIGLLLGYERWGSTAAVVSIVEKELSATEARIKDAEKRLIRLEARLVTQDRGGSTSEAVLDARNGMTQASATTANDVSAAGDTY